MRDVEYGSSGRDIRCGFEEDERQTTVRTLRTKERRGDSRMRNWDAGLDRRR